MPSDARADDEPPVGAEVGAAAAGARRGGRARRASSPPDASQTRTVPSSAGADDAVAAAVEPAVFTAPLVADEHDRRRRRATGQIAHRPVGAGGRDALAVAAVGHASGRPAASARSALARLARRPRSQMRAVPSSDAADQTPAVGAERERDDAPCARSAQRGPLPSASWMTMRREPADHVPADGDAARRAHRDRVLRIRRRTQLAERRAATSYRRTGPSPARADDLRAVGREGRTTLRLRVVPRRAVRSRPPRSHRCTAPPCRR